MNKYHINPETGAVGLCTAVNRCRFGGEKHYDSVHDASKAYEEIIENFKKNSKPSKRGKARESFSDAKNSFNRAAFDKVLGTEGNLSESWRTAVIQFHGCCYLCGKRVYDDQGNQIPGAELQADHIVPPKNGGTISAGNMAPAHRWCNDEKGDMSVQEYLLTKGRPDLLKLSNAFQAMFAYKAPDIKDVADFQEEIDAIWREAEQKVADLRVKYQERIQKR